MKTFIKYLIKYINDNSKFNTIFNHFNQTYLIENLLEALINKLKTGVTYRNINEKQYCVTWSSVYYFHKKIVKCKLFEYFFNDYTVLKN